MTNEIQNLWTAEFSVNQRQFHVAQLGDTCARNTRCMMQKYVPDYLVIGAFNTYEEAHAFIAEVEEKLRARISEIHGEKNDE